MSSPVTDASPRRQAAISERQAAVIAGLAYVVIIALSFFANVLVLGRFTSSDDPAQTVGDIADSEALLRAGFATFIAVLIADVVVAWGLYVLLQRASRELALFAAWFRLVYVAIAGAALLNLLVVMKLVDATGYAGAIEAGQRNTQAMLFLDAYHYGWDISLICFGVHLLLVGILIVRSDYAPSVLGILVSIAGLGYVVGFSALVVLPDYEDHKDLFLLFVAVLGVAGEVIGLPGWLLWKGGTTGQRAESLNSASAG